MFKQISTLALALSVAGLVGCGVAPTAQIATTGDRFVVETVGQHGHNVALNFGEALSTQAAHRWVKGDIVRYELDLMVQGEAGFTQVGAPPPVTKDKAGVKYQGLSHGKLYRVHVRILGNEGADAGKTLLHLNKGSQDTEGVGYVVYDFTKGQNINDNQSATIRLQFDSVAFDGKGGLTIVGPKSGEFDSNGNVPTVTIDGAPPVAAEPEETL